MAVIRVDVNKPERAKKLGRLLCVLVCYFCTLTDSVTAVNNSFTFEFSDTCSRNFTLSAGESPKPLTLDLVQLENRTSVTYDVKACSDVEVILYAIALQPQPQASIIHVVLGKNNESRSTIEHHGVQSDETPENPLRCGEFRRFAVSWEEKRVTVFRRENRTWVKFLVYPSTRPMVVDVHSVFVGYKLDGGDNNSTALSEWRLGVPCKDSDDEEPPGTSSMVSRSHLAGAVIAALLFGIVIGAFCVVFVPRCLKFIRGRIPSQGKDAARNGAPTEEELATPLVEVQSPDKPPSPDRPQDVKVDLSLPGDNPPPPATDPSAKRKTSGNKYTPYHEMGGTAAAAKKEDVPKKPPEVSRKPSGAGRVASPLPALPGDDAGTAAGATSESDELYVNADAHIYAGMHHEAPIYENRNTGVYEALDAPVKGK